MIRKAALMSALACGLALLGPAGAVAQEMYDTSVPSIGDVLKEVPPKMEIRFSSGLKLNEVRLIGTDNDGRQPWPIEWQKMDEDVYEVEMRPLKSLPPGKYQIEWLAYCRHHYHPDGGVIPFTIASAGQAVPTNAAAPVATPRAAAAPRVGSGWPRLVPPKDSAPLQDR